MSGGLQGFRYVTAGPLDVAHLLRERTEGYHVAYCGFRLRDHMVIWGVQPGLCVRCVDKMNEENNG